MQIKKDYHKENIREESFRLFLKNGYKGASMSMISKKIGISTSSIYTYYKSKEIIFEELVKKPIDTLNDYYRKVNIESNWNDFSTWNYDTEVKRYKSFAKVLFAYPDEFILLLRKSEGSKYENYFDELIEMFIRDKRIVKANVDKKIFFKKYPPDFITVLALESNFRVLLDHLEKKSTWNEIENVIEELTYFLFYGYRGYLNEST